MKIYFGFTVAGNRSSSDAARKIVEVFSEMGHEVLTHHLVRDDAWECDRSVTLKEVYLRDMRWLGECDLFCRGLDKEQLLSILNLPLVKISSALKTA